MPSFERYIPSAMKKMVQPKYYREVAENFEGLRAPMREIKDLVADELLAEIMPQEARDTLLRGSREFVLGEIYEHMEVVGEKASGRTHPHEFILRRSDDKTLEMFFVDPEHAIGQKNALFPSVNNLLSARFYEDGREPEIAVLRHKTVRLVNEHPEGKKVETLSSQLATARELLENQGIPKYLKGLEDQILFRLVIKREKATDRSPRQGIIQSIFSTERDLERFLMGDVAVNDAIKHKVGVERVIVERFARFMKEGKFQRANDQVKKRLKV